MNETHEQLFSKCMNYAKLDNVWFTNGSKFHYRTNKWFRNLIVQLCNYWSTCALVNPVVNDQLPTERADMQLFCRCITWCVRHYREFSIAISVDWLKFQCSHLLNRKIRRLQLTSELYPRRSNGSVTIATSYGRPALIGDCISLDCIHLLPFVTLRFMRCLIRNYRYQEN